MRTDKDTDVGYITAASEVEGERAYARAHVAELAREILEWRRTGTLAGTRLRELAQMMLASESDDKMQQAERLAETEALRVVAASGGTQVGTPEPGRYRDPKSGRE